MTSTPTRLLGQFDVRQASALRAFASAFRRAAGTAPGGADPPVFRQALVISTAAGPPPTCAISFDGGVTTLAGVRYLASYFPAADDVVEVQLRNGNPTIFGSTAS